MDPSNANRRSASNHDVVGVLGSNSNHSHSQSHHSSSKPNRVGSAGVSGVKTRPVRLVGICVYLTAGSIFLLMMTMAISFSQMEHILENPNPVVTTLQDFYYEAKNHKFTKSELIDYYYPREEPIANPTTIPDGYNTFAACMLVMDDNHRLTEWIAYHYHVLPLRYMIVAIDPRSDTSPTHLFNQWRKRGMIIIEWGDRDFWRADLKLVPIPEDAELQTKRDRHRGRQKYFYKQCLIQLKRANRTWVALHDSDEFLLYNHAGGDQFEAWEKARAAEERKLDMSVYNYKNAEKKGRKPSKHQRMKPSKPPPTVAEEGGMIQYIRQEQEAGLPYYQSPCIGIPRLIFGADEEGVDPNDIIRNVPKQFHDKVKRFDTLRYRRHAPRNDFVKNALGKVIIDVSRVDIANAPYFTSLHRPIKAICRTPWINDWESGLRINHYLGSWESYAFRNDARRGGERSQEQWEWKATTTTDMSDDNISPWLDGFVQSHGEQEAEEWLQHVGLPSNYHNPDDYKWKLNADRLISILESDEQIEEIPDKKQIAFEDWVRQKYAHMKDELLQRAKKAVAETEDGKVPIIWTPNDE